MVMLTLFLIEKSCGLILIHGKPRMLHVPMLDCRVVRHRFA